MSEAMETEVASPASETVPAPPLAAVVAAAAAAASLSSPSSASSSASARPLNPLLVDPMDETLPTHCAEEGCGRVEFAFYGLLERHRVDWHGQDEVMVCGRCATGFKRKMNLVLHWRSTAHRFIKSVS